MCIVDVETKQVRACESYGLIHVPVIDWEELKRVESRMTEEFGRCESGCVDVQILMENVSVRRHVCNGSSNCNMKHLFPTNIVCLDHHSSNDRGAWMIAQKLTKQSSLQSLTIEQMVGPGNVHSHQAKPDLKKICKPTRGQRCPCCGKIVK
eukprot:TRINITY_DN13445_c0_g1_i2.p1 TRINITY_DN13445_c0_g1~~TRINITY_DN13445_c0_g1_i2.p1  ORF type:complete len:158 (+),score=23.74 TRINITY_DN13445_c0_g1_i2:22-474(+)